MVQLRNTMIDRRYSNSHTAAERRSILAGALAVCHHRRLWLQYCTRTSAAVTEKPRDDDDLL